MIAHLAPGAGTPQETQKWGDKTVGSVPNGTSYFTSSSNWWRKSAIKYFLKILCCKGPLLKLRFFFLSVTFDIAQSWTCEITYVTGDVEGGWGGVSETGSPQVPGQVSKQTFIFLTQPKHMHRGGKQPHASTTECSDIKTSFSLLLCCP